MGSSILADGGQRIMRIVDEHPELRHEQAAHQAVHAHRVGFLRDVSASIVDLHALVAAIAVIALLFALTH
jgi:hypothetical protein